MRAKRLWLQRALAAALGIAVGVGALELTARSVLPDRYYVHTPGFRETFAPQPEIVHGVSGPSRFRINAQGMRAGPFSPEQRFQLLAVGGSTTICIYLDDDEAWPHLVEERLGAALGRGTVWVGNVGSPGHTTTQHAIQVEKLLAQHPEIDAVVLLVGVNDLLIALSARLDPATAAQLHAARDDPAALIESAFRVFPVANGDATWYWRTGIGRLWLGRNLFLPRWRADDTPVVDTTGSHLARWRGYRKQASRFRELPDLRAALDQYARNLNRILDAAAAEGVRAFFLTQPTLWREDLSAAELDLLWTGGPGLDRLAPGSEYYSVAALAEGMRLYNERLLRVCRERDADCFELASHLPRDATIFFDDAHFTEEGSRRVAELVTGYLLRHRSLLTPRSPRPEQPTRG